MTSVEDYLARVFLPLAVALVLGGILGLERQWTRHKAGVRTQMLMTVGAALFAMLPVLAMPEDPSAPGRVLQGVAAGIGFIGAGTILKLSQPAEVKGLTTAGSIWVAAGIGSAAGLRLYALAATATALAVFVLWGIKWLEGRGRGKLPHGSESPSPLAEE
jgi:putative Mg2+ transporter-C (MgtC) family protein